MPKWCFAVSSTCSFCILLLLQCLPVVSFANDDKIATCDGGRTALLQHPTDGFERMKGYEALHQSLIFGSDCDKDLSLLWDNDIQAQDVHRDGCAVDVLRTLPQTVAFPSPTERSDFIRALNECKQALVPVMQKEWQKGRQPKQDPKDHLDGEGKLSSIYEPCKKRPDVGCAGRNDVEPGKPYTLVKKGDGTYDVKDPYYRKWQSINGAQRTNIDALRSNVPRYKTWSVDANGKYKWRDTTEAEMNHALANRLYVGNPGSKEQPAEMVVPADPKSVALGTVVDIANIDPEFVPAQFKGDNEISAEAAILALAYARSTGLGYSGVIAQTFAGEMVSRAWKQANVWRLGDTSYLAATREKQFRSYLSLPEDERKRDEYIIKAAAACIYSHHLTLRFPTRKYPEDVQKP